MGDVEVDKLSAVIVALPKGDGKTNLPYWNSGTISDSWERLGWLKLIVWHLEIVERLDGQDIEPCSAIDEGLGDLDVADDGGTEHQEGAGSCRALELVRRAEGDDALGPLERARCLEPGKGCVHLTGKLPKDALRGWGLSSAQDAGDRVQLLEAPSPSS